MTAPLKWTVRAEKRSGALLPAVTSRFGPVYGYRRLTVWIHGFNTSEYSANDKWEETHSLIRERTGLNELKGTVWFFWPGDAARSRIVSAPLYFAQVEDALKAGNALAEYIIDLQTKDPSLEVNLVAHSLGCRIAVEAARQIREVGARPVSELLLFAAAIPEGLCGEGSIYDQKVATRERIYYSQSDRILKTWFPMGQLLARRFRGDANPGKQKLAVGYTGGPVSRWGAENIRAVEYAHDGYWSGEQSLSAIGALYGVNRKQPRVQNKQPVVRVMGSRPLLNRYRAARWNDSMAR